MVELPPVRVKFRVHGSSPDDTTVDFKDYPTVGSVLDMLILMHPEVANGQTAQLRRDIMVMLNGENIQVKDGPLTKLKGDDEILILSVSGGG